MDYYVTATTSIKSDPWARVIAFDRTACAEGIEHGVTGWIAPNGDFAAYADGLTHDFSEWKSGALGSSLATVASWAARNFQSCVLAGKICNVYAQVGGLDNMNLKVHNTHS